jgi:Fe-Mn family superoxide dismutase
VAEYMMPQLDYDYGALEPHISGGINEIHHSKHHATYVKGASSMTSRPMCRWASSRAAGRHVGATPTTWVKSRGVVYGVVV